MAKKSAKKTAKKVVKKATKKIAKKVTKKTAAAERPVAKKTDKKPVVKAEQKTTAINPYLTFNGNCEEAFNLYRSVFGGQFNRMMRFKDAPPAEGQPPMSENIGN